MRKALIAFVATSFVGLIGCEDGPTQVYQPAPDGAGNRWNDGRSGGIFDDGGMQGFVGDQNAGANAQELCSGPKRAARWAKMVSEPIAPPGRVAGVDGFGNTETVKTWTGLTIAQAEGINCQSEPSGNTFGDGDIVNQWGDNGEVWVKYNPNTQRVDWFVINNGYLGKMEFQSRDGKDKFVLGLGTPIYKNGNVFALDWSAAGRKPTGADAKGPTFDPASYPSMVTELADALFATYAPELTPEDPSHGTCFTSGRCVQTIFGGQEGVSRIYPLGLHIWVDNPDAPQPVPSTPSRVDMRLPRIEPYTYAVTNLKLDAEGPVAISAGTGPGGADCKLKLGTRWADFIGECIRTTGDTTKDDTFFNKLVGSIRHDSERYFFDVTGVDVNVTSVTLGPTEVLRDSDRPKDDDVVSSLYIDAATLGLMGDDHILDDTGHLVLDKNGKAQKDLHGAGRVYLEYAYIVQSTLNSLILAADPTAIVHKLGDPDCLADIPAKLDQKGNPIPKKTANCTGFEGIVTAAPPPANAKELDAANRIGPDAKSVGGGVLALGLKPGKPQVLFCADATGDASTGYNDCVSGAIFDTSFQQVIATLGGGDLAKLPSAVRDRRFFYKAYVTALVKLFKATGQGPLPDTLLTVKLNSNDFFFDAEGGGQYERGEYVDRATENAGQGLTDVEIVADILNGTVLSYQFFRSIYRGEAAVYQSVTQDAANLSLPGKEETSVTTNIYGSPALSALWTDHAASDDSGNALTPRSAYYCASTGWQTQAQYDQLNAECEGNIAPIDTSYTPKDAMALPAVPLLENGVPILTPYPNAFSAGSPFSLDPFTQGAGSLKLIKENVDTRSAIIEVPIPVNGTTTQVIVPYTPPRPGFGWPYPVSGTRDQVVESGILEFAGTTLTGNMFYVETPEKVDGKATGNKLLQLQAVVSNDYLGDIFVCIEGNDILRAKMYDPVLPILEWLDAHPAAYSDCGIIVRYSVFDNFPDYIISQVNGVVLSATQGAGFGRVNNVMLFTPGTYLTGPAMRTNKPAFVFAFALAAAASSASCISHRPTRNGVFNENQYLRKDFIVKSGATDDASDPGWLMKATITRTSTPNPLGGLTFGIFPGAENGTFGGNLVRFKVTQDKLQMLNMREISPDTILSAKGRIPDPNKEPETVDAWPATNVDLKYRVNLDGEATNFYEENQEQDWEVRQYLKLNFAKNDLSDVQAFGTMTNEWFQKCTDWTEATTSLSPGSFKVDYDRNYMEWTVSVSSLVNFDDPACIEAYGARAGTALGIGRQNVSFDIRYSFVRANPNPTDVNSAERYEPLELPEKDPIRHKYGVQDFIALSRDDKSGQLAARQFVIRYNPNKPKITWWFDASFPDRYKPAFQKIATDTNKLFADAGAKAQIEFKDATKDVAEGEPVPSKGDVRFNILYWISDKDVQDDFAGVTQYVVDPRTGELLTASIGFNDFAIKDVYVQRIDAYLKSVGACAAYQPGDANNPPSCPFDVNSPDDPANPQQWPDPPGQPPSGQCTAGATVPIVDSYAVKYHNATSSLSSKIQDYLHKSASTTNPATGDPYGPLSVKDLIPPSDPEYDRAFINVLPYFVFSDPDVNPFVTPEGQQGVFGPGEMKKVYQQEADFHAAMGAVDRGEVPFQGLTGPQGFQNAVDFSHNLQGMVRNHRRFGYSKNFIRHGMSLDAPSAFSFEQIIQRDARHCIIGADGKTTHWESRDEWVQNLIDTYWTQVIWHEFGHAVGLGHNFMGSVDKPNFPVTTDAGGNPTIGLYSNSVMEYNGAPDRVFWTPGWGPYDQGAIAFIYGNSSASHAAAAKSPPMDATTLSITGQVNATFPWNDKYGFGADGNEKRYLFCDERHLKYSPFCRQGDMGSSPAEIIANQIEAYDWQYQWRNFRAYRKIWDDSQYADTPTAMIEDMRRFLPMWSEDWDQADLIELMRRTKAATPPDGGWTEAYYESMFARFNAHMSAANQMVGAFHKAVIQQSSGERPYKTTYDPFYGDVNQQGIVIDKLMALNAWTTLWPVDDYSRNRTAGQYIGSFSQFGDGEYQSVTEDAVESMVGGQYNDVFPYFKPLAVAQYADATHDINFTGRIEVRDWIGGYQFGREQDFLEFFRSKAVVQHLPECDTATTNTLGTCTYDPRQPVLDVYHANSFNEFIGPDHRRWTFAYIQDRNQWVVVDQDRNTVSYLLVRQYNADVVNAQNDGSASSDFGGPYSELLPLKYLLDSFRQYN